MASASIPEDGGPRLSLPSSLRRGGSTASFSNLPDLSVYLDSSGSGPGIQRTAAVARSTALIGFLTLLVLSLSLALWSSRTPDLSCPDCNCGAEVAAAPPRSETGAEAMLGLGLSFFTVTLAFCVLTSYLMLQYDLSFMPDCIAYVLLGALVGSVFRVFGASDDVSISLPNEEQFFIFILPPIMFEAGYSLSKKDFFAEAGSICVFAIPGTIISALVFGVGIYGTGLLGASYLFSFWEAMTFGALLSAVDPVATMAVFSALKVNKTLHFLVFGESVLNDAVAIVLYRTFSKLIGSTSYAWYTIVLDFIRIFVGSGVIGVASGTCAALVLKHTSLYRTPSLEMSFFLLMAYFPYFLCDGLELSGIMGILVNGIVLSHYAHHNLSKVTQISAQQSFRTLAFLAETFVFVFLGSALTTFEHSWNGLTIMWGIILTLVSRAANIYPLTSFVNRWRADKITRKNQLIMWFSGLRGAVAFALSLNVPSNNGSDDTRRVIISTTLAIVLFTVIVLGGGIMPLLRLLRVEGAEDDVPADIDHGPAMQPRSLGSSTGISPSRASGVNGNGTLPRSISRRNGDGGGRIMKVMQRFDEEYMVPWLIAASTRSMAATNRTLQTLAVAENDRLTPHQLGMVLENTAATVIPDPTPLDDGAALDVFTSDGAGESTSGADSEGERESGGLDVADSDERGGLLANDASIKTAVT
jgi:solute carrier family 9 (sodium/hydrogen exchanger), member 8